MSTQCRTIHIVVWANFLAAFGAILDCHLSRTYRGHITVKAAHTYPTALLNTFTRNSPRPSLTTGHRATYPLKQTIQVAKVLYTLSAVEV